MPDKDLDKFPKLDSGTFICPHCNSLSNHIWSTHINVTAKQLSPHKPNDLIHFNLDGYKISSCRGCLNNTIWNKGELIYPLKSSINDPNQDLSDDIKGIYNEARNVFPYSKKASAALLRLSIQHLCKDLGGKGENISEDITTLKKNGLPESITQGLNVIRIIGNNSVHPGQIDISDDEETTRMLFDIVNIIAQVMISDKKMIQSLHDKYSKKMNSN